MLSSICFIALLILTSVFIYRRTALRFWLPTILIALIASSVFQLMNLPLLIISWAIFAITVILFVIPQTRSVLFSAPLAKALRKILPPISDTERAALEAGNIGFEGEIFSGRPRWENFLNLPEAKLTAEEQSFVDNEVEQFCAMIDDWQIVHIDHDLTPAAWNFLKQKGFFGLVIPKKYGGKGFSAYAHSTIVTKIATRSMSAAVTVMVPNSLGPGELLERYGLPEQKNYYLPRLARGEEVPCFGLTGVEVGSDATAMPDTGVVCKGIFEGKEVIGIKLNFNKRYITLAPVATLLGLAFKMYDPEHLLGNENFLGITVCLVPTHLPGIEIGERHNPLNLAFMNGPVRGKDVFVPIDYIIGGVEKRGKGWQMLMEALSVGRGISIPALATGGCKLAYLTTSAYSLIRQQFRTSIGQFEAVADSLARIGGFTYLAEASRHFITSAIDAGEKPSLATAMIKYHMSEAARIACNDSMDIHAGRAIQQGPRNYIGNLYLAIPVSITVEGANILTRSLIIFGQGAVRCHPFVKNEMDALSDSDLNRGLNKFDKLLAQHAGYSASNFLRALFSSLTGGRFLSAPQSKLKREYQKIARLSTALALTADMALMLLGGELKRKETLSMRLGDAMSHLYLASCCLKYFEDHKNEQADLLPYVKWNLARSLNLAGQALDQFYQNFPRRFMAKILRWICFPFGMRFRPATDQLSMQISQEMLQENAINDFITRSCFIKQDESDAVGRVVLAKQLFYRSTEARAKLQAAIKKGSIARDLNLSEQLLAAANSHILTTDEIALIKQFEYLRYETIRVDDFAASGITLKEVKHG